ncbi:PLAC8 family-domain-containing protein [Gymnopilus junonius]|uniref:PLAC8 family-domain-containing protein n=1 Tax=Gymnopilus junonius TaxID=109634 RepID=A0A9P5TN37_GYMJU|nr:PLAC8 family-domain-containing protein [Gymnopilus junonius]
MAYTQQPTATPGMNVGGGNRNSKNLPVEGDGREWSESLFGCFEDITTCLIATCFPCITYSNVKHRYEHLNNKGYPDPEHGGSFCNGDCMVHGCLTFCGCGWAMQMGTRGNIRGRYNIKGGAVGDCCIALCCTPCELTQESRELALEEESFNGKQG